MRMKLLQGLCSANAIRVYACCVVFDRLLFQGEFRFDLELVEST
jgi:hypothetical protein